jgi:hypothetical protein
MKIIAVLTCNYIGRQEVLILVILLYTKTIGSYRFHNAKLQNGLKMCPLLTNFERM